MTSREAVDAPDVVTGIEYLARFGYAAKGIVYGTIGVLALASSLGFRGGRLVGTQSAIETLRNQPFGQFIAWSLVVGLTGYVIWRVVQAVFDPEHKGTDVVGLAKRAGLLISGASYATLAWFTAARLLGSPGGGGDDGARESTAEVMQYEGGGWLVILVGLVFVGVGVFQGYRAYAITFNDEWHRGSMSRTTYVWATRLSRIGITARAISFGLIGSFFIRAGMQLDASEATGLEGALQSFAHGRFGTLWLGAIGTGFVCYGIYCLVNARFRRINP